MPEINGFETGQFCWAELTTTDQDGAKSFYTTLFGWGLDEQPIPDDGVYSMFTLKGRHVGAASTQRDEERNQGIPPHWNLYIAVDDADSYAKKAEAAGGTVIMPAFDVMDAGRMAVIADPTGAVVGLWQAGQHRGYGIINETYAPNWHELLTPDAAKAVAFYTETFGWDASEFPTGDAHPYTVFKRGDDQLAGAMQNPQGMESMPANWNIYYSVPDCAATVEKVKELGGQVYFGPQAIPDVGTFATCADPQGAAFSVLEPQPSAES